MILLLLQVLIKVLDSTHHGFALELASVASWRQLLNLEKWLSDHIAHDNATFVPSILKFLDSKTQVQVCQVQLEIQEMNVILAYTMN